MLRGLIVVPALLLLAAHFYRAELYPVAVLAAAGVALLALRARWAAAALQVALALGVLEWLRTLASFAMQRAASGQPWLRLALILGAVALFTALAAWAAGRVRQPPRLTAVS